jgi:hypothetical protein
MTRCGSMMGGTDVPAHDSAAEADELMVLNARPLPRLSCISPYGIMLV